VEDLLRPWRWWSAFGKKRGKNGKKPGPPVHDDLVERDFTADAPNAAMESFFSLLQKNVLNRRSWKAREELRIAIVTWIERTYHRRRRQAALGRLTPVEYELIMTTTATQAA
jgi:hypothetical protein